MSEGNMEQKIDRWIGAASALMRTLKRPIVVKIELSQKSKLSIYRSIYIPTLTYGYDTGCDQKNEIFHRRVAGLSLRDKLRSLNWFSNGLQMSLCPHGGVGGSGQAEEYLDLPGQAVASMTRTRITKQVHICWIPVSRFFICCFITLFSVCSPLFKLLIVRNMDISIWLTLPLC